jgi:hypothetical protein
MLGRLNRAKPWLIVVLLFTGGVGSAGLIFSQRASVKASDDKTIIRGGRTTCRRLRLMRSSRQSFRRERQ